MSWSNMEARMADHGLGRAARALGCAAALAALGACSSTQQTPFGLPGDAHKITVEQRPEKLSLALAPRMTGLTAAQRDALRGYAAAYLDHGYGPLAISMPQDTDTTAAGRRAAEQARQLLHAAGIDWAVIAQGGYQASGTSGAPLILSFTRYIAHAEGCGGDWRNLATSPGNNESANFGCALAVNTAAMIADPYELVRPSATRPPSAPRRQTVMDKYTKGEATGAARSSDEKVKVSDATD